MLYIFKIAGGSIMKIKKITSLFFVLTFALTSLFITHSVQAAQPITPEQAYRQFLAEKVSQKKYFQIVNIGNKNTPVLIIGKGEKDDINNKICFQNCKVYTFYNGQIQKMKAFKNYGGRCISLKEKNGKYYLSNGLSDAATFYTIKKDKVITHEYFNCHSAKGNDRTNKSVFKRNGKVIKNLGYLKASKYEKRRNSYKTVESAINFIQNTAANRNNITK